MKGCIPLLGLFGLFSGCADAPVVEAGGPLQQVVFDYALDSMAEGKARMPCLALDQGVRMADPDSSVIAHLHSRGKTFLPYSQCGEPFSENWRSNVLIWVSFDTFTVTSPKAAIAFQRTSIGPSKSICMLTKNHSGWRVMTCRWDGEMH